MKTDYLYALENILPVKRLRRAILCLTNLCNSRCKTCFLWKNKKREELDFEILEKFAETGLFKKIRFLSLTGGEPFLRKDIDKIVNMFKQKNKKLHITILSNALMPDVIYEKVKNMPKDVLITLSFNGKEETHDETRGIGGNFKKLLETIEKLRSLGINTSLIFTVTKENYDQLLWAWEFAKEKNMNILFSPEMDYGRLNHVGDRTLSKEQKQIVLNQLKKIYGERKRGFFDYTYLLFFRKFYEKKNITNKCYAGTNSIYIDYTGNIYPCENLVGRISALGNIKNNFTIPRNYSSMIKKSKCYEGCYLLCEMVRNLRKHPLKTLREKN
ncbi:MAG: radical SAM protein [Candidatus Nanoarchaeia archaeon]|nr:radical SAM protein [Candidatus Nanoarchaeia archaeon]MDD5358140.1 radical SAM protein [Candidatus Nanoarchaeia archaeon]MDD5589327.1 radical SAM protein [Candidatus Nanoarchaeia archaeon]